MKTTIFLLALYGIFGFFACKQADVKLKPSPVQVAEDRAAGKQPLKAQSVSPQGGSALAGSLRMVQQAAVSK